MYNHPDNLSTITHSQRAAVLTLPQASGTSKENHRLIRLVAELEDVLHKKRSAHYRFAAMGQVHLFHQRLWKRNDCGAL